MNNSTYRLCKAPDGRQFYMAGKIMFSCLGYNTVVVNDRVTGHEAIAPRQYANWREMADDMEASGIDNIFAPFARDWG